jgi:hypothetical protein
MHPLLGVPWRIEDRTRDDVLIIFVSSLPIYASIAGGYVLEDSAEPVQIEDRVGNGIPTIFVNSLSTYALQGTKYKWRTAETQSLPYL